MCSHANITSIIILVVFIHPALAMLAASPEPEVQAQEQTPALSRQALELVCRLNFSGVA
jgi:hypothetical protein